MPNYRVKAVNRETGSEETLLVSAPGPGEAAAQLHRAGLLTGGVWPVRTTRLRWALAAIVLAGAGAIGWAWYRSLPAQRLDRAIRAGVVNLGDAENPQLWVTDGFATLSPKDTRSIMRGAHSRVFGSEPENAARILWVSGDLTERVLGSFSPEWGYTPNPELKGQHRVQSLELQVVQGPPSPYGPFQRSALELGATLSPLLKQRLEFEHRTGFLDLPSRPELEAMIPTDPGVAILLASANWDDPFDDEARWPTGRGEGGHLVFPASDWLVKLADASPGVKALIESAAASGQIELPQRFRLLDSNRGDYGVAAFVREVDRLNRPEAEGDG